MQFSSFPSSIVSSLFLFNLQIVTFTFYLYCINLEQFLRSNIDGLDLFLELEVLREILVILILQ